MEVMTKWLKINLFSCQTELFPLPPPPSPPPPAALPSSPGTPLSEEAALPPPPPVQTPPSHPLTPGHEPVYNREVCRNSLLYLHHLNVIFKHSIPIFLNKFQLKQMRHFFPQWYITSFHNFHRYSIMLCSGCKESSAQHIMKEKKNSCLLDMTESSKTLYELYTFFLHKLMSFQTADIFVSAETIKEQIRTVSWVTAGGADNTQTLPFLSYSTSVSLYNISNVLSNYCLCFDCVWFMGI